MRVRLLCLALGSVWAAGLHADTGENEQAPNLELLEYLAEYTEDENGRLIDPMDQPDDNETRSYTYQEYMQERTGQ